MKTLENKMTSAAALAPATCSVESVNRQVIKNQLLTALDDKSKVAILATEDDLKMLIRALHTSSIDGAKEREMERDLIQLRSAAFPPNDRADLTPTGARGPR